jgi:hypothetical protein
VQIDHTEIDMIVVDEQNREPIPARPWLTRAIRIDAKLFDWTDEITADCPRKLANKLDDLCSARCPDLPRSYKN